MTPQEMSDRLRYRVERKLSDYSGWHLTGAAMTFSLALAMAQHYRKWSEPTPSVRIINVGLNGREYDIEWQEGE